MPPQLAAAPCGGTHAFCGPEGGERRGEYVARVPPVFETRVLSLRGFDADGMMAEALLTQPGEAEAGIRTLFTNPQIETIHAHNATRGCFSAKIERNCPWPGLPAGFSRLHRKACG